LPLDALGVGAEGYALPCNGFVEIGEGLEVFVDRRLVNMNPQRFDGLQFGGVGRQVDEPDPPGQDEPLPGVPAGIVQHEDDDAPRPRAGLLCKERKQRFE
jgi:hypothetical protein